MLRGIKNVLDFKDRLITPQDILDIRHFRETGPDLMQRITESVAATQSPLLVIPLPNILVLTRAQFDDLQTDLDRIGDYESARQMLFITPLNAMDIRVVE